MALVERPSAQMFDLIEAAEDYPRFLPWCTGAVIVCRDDAVVSADLRVNWRGLAFEMRTRNPKQRPHFMAIHLERGPFRHFEGEWRLARLDAGACRVDFSLDYEFDSTLATRLSGPLFDRIADTMVDVFVRRALAQPLRIEPAAPPPAAAPAAERPPAPPDTIGG